MAEFPDLGKNCSLETCKRLDYTPFLCDLCKRYFCGEHRLSHGCKHKSKPVNNEDPPTPSGPLRPYLCASNGCHLKESIRIECPHCKLNFCLSHRHPDEHKCKYLPENAEREQRMIAFAELQKKIEASETYTHCETPLCGTTTKKVLSDVEQKRTDRIAIMRMKSKVKPGDIPRGDQLFLMAVLDQARVPVVVSKRWSIGKCVDKIARDLNIPNNNAEFEAKMLRLYCEESDSQALPMADNVTGHLKDMNVIVVKRDE